MTMNATLGRSLRTGMLVGSLGVLAAACGSSSTASASALLTKAYQRLTRAGTYVVTVGSLSPSQHDTSAPTSSEKVEVDTKTKTFLFVETGTGLSIRLLKTPSATYLQLPDITTSPRARSTWYVLPRTLAASEGTGNASATVSTSRLIRSLQHPKRDGTVVVSGTTCTLIEATVPFATIARLDGISAATAEENSIAGTVTIQIAIAPSGFPLRLTERFPAALRFPGLALTYSDFGTPLHISAPPSSQVKSITPSQLQGLLGGLGQ